MTTSPKIQISETKKEDFDKVYPILSKFNTRSKETWENLFTHEWHNNETRRGYMLLDQDQVVGFWGLIFSRRIINDVEHKFCNLTSWIVKEEYRKHSLSLLLSIHKIKDCTLSCVTPSYEVTQLLTKFGFKTLDTHFTLIPCLPLNIPKKTHYKFHTNENAIVNNLSKTDLKIHKQHLPYNTLYFNLSNTENNCYVLMTLTKKKGLTFGLIHYISNKQVFEESIGNLHAKICMHFKIWGLLIYTHMLGNHCIFPSVKIKLPRPTMYKPNNISKTDVNTLHTELILLK